MTALLKAQSGRSMIEIIGVLAVVGVLSVGGIAGYIKAMEKINTNKLIEDVAFTLRNIRALYGKQTNYEDIDKNIFSIDVVQGVTKIDGMEKKMLHRLNGEVIVKPIAYNKGYVVVYNGLNEVACTTLSSMNFGGSGSGVKFMVVSPTGIIPPRGYPSNLDWGEFKGDDLPLPLAETSTYCKCYAFYKCGIAWFF